MIAFKCKMCGGEMELEKGATVAECPYCLTKQTLPKLDNDKRANMYDRANHFRRQNEYDKAMAIFESILQEDRTDAEAYWSLVLCRYGIEYVEDPATHKRVPTVNRVQYTSILADEDYKSALEYADFAQRSVYEEEAKAIDEIQKGILAISKQEKPFDVFICYKETDANGRRTPDSVLANDLYHQLTNEGFKVFFSRITLEDKIGTAYEPYIFAALNSAKVMVVLGTKPEYFNAVWVKNEWSRYLALIRAGADKTLVPAYRDMDPYDLPEEFSHLQAQDMGKLGFMQDLIRGIKKLTTKEAPKPQTVVQQSVGAGANIENLMKRVRLFLEDSNYTSADEYLDRVLDENAEYAPAYIGKVLVKQKLHREEDLGSTLLQYEQDPNWAKALRFATPEQKGKYETYLENSKQARKEKSLSDQYNAALAALGTATDEQGCYQAKRQFMQISSYKDSQARMEECDKKALRIAYDRAENKRLAIMRQIKTVSNAKELEKLAPEYEKLGDYSDAKSKAQLCRNSAESMRESVYDAATERLKNASSMADVDAAEKVFIELGYSYKEVSSRLAVCKQKKELFTKVEKLDTRRRSLINQKSSMSVVKQWDALGEEYKKLEVELNNSNGSTTCFSTAIHTRRELYQNALKAKQAAASISDFEKAASLFEELEGFEDSNDQVRACREAAAKIKTEQAKEARKKRNTKIIIAAAFASCIAIVILVTQYIIPKSTYGQAEALLAEGKYEEASAKFAEVGNHFDAPERVYEPFYVHGMKYYEQQQYTDARDQFLLAGNYKDASTMAKKCMYEYAEKLNTEGKYKEAATALSGILDYEDASTKYSDINYSYGMSLYKASNYAEAIIPLACSGKEDGIKLAEELRTRYTDRVSVGYSHVYAVTDDGSVLACGDNSRGLLAASNWKNMKKVIGNGSWNVFGLTNDGKIICINDNNYEKYISNVESWSNVKDLAVFGSNIIALHNDGRVSGLNTRGDYGFNTSSWTNVVQISPSNHNISALRSDGTAYSTGNNEQKQMSGISSFSNVTYLCAGCWDILGVKADGSIAYSGDMTRSKGKESIYKKITSWTNIKKVVVGGYFEFAGLRNDGTVVVSDDFNWDFFDPKITPSAVSGWRDIVDIACNSDYFVIGLKKDGTVVYAGELYSSTKKDDTIIDVSTLNTWTDIIAVYTSGSSVVGLKSDGTLLFAGISNYSQSIETGKWKLW